MFYAHTVVLNISHAVVCNRQVCDVSILYLYWQIVSLLDCVSTKK